MFVLVMMLSDSSLWNHLTKIMGLFYKKKKKKKNVKHQQQQQKIINN